MTLRPEHRPSKANHARTRWLITYCARPDAFTFIEYDVEYECADFETACAWAKTCRARNEQVIAVVRL